MEHFSVSTTVRSSWNTTGYKAIVRDILGPDFAVSVVLIGDRKARTLNKLYRNKDSSANVLTFPLSKTDGEIFINIAKVKREASTFGLTPNNHARYLLIHGCLHLKGYSHGSTMEKAEEQFLKKHTTR